MRVKGLERSAADRITGALLCERAGVWVYVDVSVDVSGDGTLNGNVSVIADDEDLV